MEENQNKSENIDLTGIKKSGEFLLYIKFMGTPVQFRENIYGYKTDVDFALKNNVNKDTLTIWKNRAGFGEAVKKELYKYCKNKTPAVVGALLDKIMRSGDKQEVEFWFRLFEDYRDVNDVNIINDIDKKTAEMKELLESWQNNQNGGKQIDTTTETADAIRERFGGSPPSA